MPSSTEFPPEKEFSSVTDCPVDSPELDLETELTPYFSSMEDEGIASIERTDEYIDEREYGLQETIDAAKEIFTKEVITDWKNKSSSEKKEIAQRYAEAVAEALGVKSGKVYFIPWPPNERGKNNGDGNLYLNYDMIRESKNVIDLIDTIAHETRHSFQMAAVANPARFGISPEVAKEWEYGFRHYHTYGATQYDPWGYSYNPVEIDARYFGESVVRGLTQDIIAGLKDGETLMGTRV